MAYGLVWLNGLVWCSYLHQLHSAKTTHAQRSNHLNQIHRERGCQNNNLKLAIAISPCWPASCLAGQLCYSLTAC
jgi:hypothetical protein